MKDFVKKGLEYAGMEASSSDIEQVVKFMEAMNVSKQEFEQTNVDNVLPYLITDIGGKEND